MSNVCKVAVHYRITNPMPDPIPDDIVEGAITFHVSKTDGADPWSADNQATLRVRVFQWLVDEVLVEGHDDEGDEATYWPRMLAVYATEAFAFTSIATQRVQPTLSDAVVLDFDEPGDDGNIAMNYPQLAVCVGLRTLVNTGRYRGRIFMPARQDVIGDALNIPSGRLSVNTQGIYARAIAHLAARIFGPDPAGLPEPWTLCVYSRVDGDSRAVHNFVVADRWCTQRRRAIRPLDHTVWGLDGIQDT